MDVKVDGLLAQRLTLERPQPEKSYYSLYRFGMLAQIRSLPFRRWTGAAAKFRVIDYH
jgi:hypothetical protein